MIKQRTHSVAMVLFLAFLIPASGAPTRLSSGQWTLSVDAEQATLTVNHALLGDFIQQAQLQLQRGESLQPLTHWVVTQPTTDSLLIQTLEPRTAWRFDLGETTLRVSCTSAQALLTAAVPAPAHRIPARLLDPEGTPVDWEGTKEVYHGYGGDVTWNQSYLPRENPEVMYFALGQVSNPKTHALFDRQTDTAVQFGEQAELRRSERDRSWMDLSLPIPGNAAIRITPDYFTRTLGVPLFVPFDDSIFPRAPIVWCSWTSYYEEVRESDIVKNADWLATHLKPYGFEYVQIDDGYDRGPEGEHYWIERWDEQKFPHGPEWLARTIKSKGLRPGLWLVPNAYAGALKEHPDWYLHFKDGSLVRDYNTPALDSSNPEVREFLRHLFTQLRDWGFEYYKFDGEHAIPRYVPNVDLSRLSAPNSDPFEVYRQRVELIREAIGPRTFVEGCPAGTPLNALGYYNSSFAGDDVYNSWQGMYPLFSSINANAFLNHIVVYLMPGEGIELGPEITVEEAEKIRYPTIIDVARSREEPLRGFGVSLAEARTLVSHVSLTGVVYPLASVMPELPAERVQLLKQTMPTLPILPTDLFSRGTDMAWDKFKQVEPDFYLHNYPEIIDLKVHSDALGESDVVAVTNWSGATIAHPVDLKKTLGLDPAASYLAFDFWQQRPLGVVQGTLPLDVDSHDTRVVQLRKLASQPQLLGTSRHITGAVSVRQLTWDASTQQLEGVSETIAGEPYTLWFHVPAGQRATDLQASTSAGTPVALHSDVDGEWLQVSLEGQASAISWRIAFSR